MCVKYVFAYHHKNKKKLGKIWNSNLGLYQKIQFSIFFIDWGKLKSPTKGTFRNSKLSLGIGKNLEIKPETNTQKSQFRTYG